VIRKTLYRAVRAGAGAALRSISIDAATRDAPGFVEVWPTVDGIPGWFDRVNAAAFWGVIAERRPRTVVEIGSYLGRSTALLGLALKRYSPEARLVAIDPHTGDRQQLLALGTELLPTADLFRKHVQGVGIAELLDIRIARSDEVAAEWDGPVELLFVDGWHSYDAVVSDARNWVPHLHGDGVVCFDDFTNYTDVHEAVIDSCRDLGLTIYGTVLAQAWAGYRGSPPRALTATMRWTRLLPESRLTKP